MRKNHSIYKCMVFLPCAPLNVPVLITVYSCADYYVKYPWHKRAQRVDKNYLRIMFPRWYHDEFLKGGE